MGGIFISYRRIDTGPWAGRLFDYLKGRFGVAQVFMDINGGIPRGADFEKVLTDKLSSCDGLLALIGPNWLTCTGDDGRRRLDVPEDWVRTEIATALKREILVMPVLLGGAKLRPEDELPQDLILLRKRQCAEVLDNRWESDVGELIKDLLRQVHLQLLPGNEVVSAATGIRLLKDLMVNKPRVADAVSRSKELIENTYRRLGKLEIFKAIHDALHTIEFECLRPMQEGSAASRVRPFKITFATEARRIHERVQGQELNPALRDDLMEQLDIIATAFQVAVDTPGDASYRRVVGELNTLLSNISSRLDSGISDAATELNLDRIVTLMSTVRSTLSAANSEKDNELEPFVKGMDALQRLREELTGRVTEHAQLQRLDTKLRTVCVAGIARDSLVAEWGRIKSVQSKLAAPFSVELAGARDDLSSIESEIDSAIGRSEEQMALDLLREYFRAVSTVFRDVDKSLKDFCLRLSAVAQPLKTVLDMC
jgi:TIR domain